MHRRTLYALFLVLPLLGTTSLLSGCGQKGPLYLPDPAEQAQEEEAKKKQE